MPSRLQFQTKTTDAEEHKKRQEKFRKRKKSIFSKAKLLAKDTNAWVALIVRDRAGQVDSFVSSNSPYWPPSRKDLLKKHPLGTHEFLEKHAVSGCWKQVAEDESDLALQDGDTDSFVEDITTRMNSIESEVISESNESVNQCRVGKEVGASADVPKAKRLKRIKPQRSAVDTLRNPDSIAADAATESNYTNTDGLREPNSKSPDKAGEPYHTTLDSDRETDDIVVDFGGSDNNIIDMVKQLKTATQDIPIELDNTTDLVLGDSDNAKEISQKSTLMDMLDMVGVDPIASEYDMMDLELPEKNSRVETEARESVSIEATRVLHTISQYNDREVINEPRITFQDGGQGCDSKMSTGIDPKELLEGWDWIFQRK